MDKFRREAINKALNDSVWISGPDSSAGCDLNSSIDDFEKVLREEGYAIVPVVISGTAGLNAHDTETFQRGYMLASEKRLTPNKDWASPHEDKGLER